MVCASAYDTSPDSKMEERYIADDKNLHDDEFLSGLKTMFSSSALTTHIAELADDRVRVVLRLRSC